MKKLTGNTANLSGDCSGLWGDCSGLSGDCSGLSGVCSGMEGDLGDCGLTAESRSRNIENITSLKFGVRTPPS